MGAFQRLFGASTHTPCADILGLHVQHSPTQPRLTGRGELSYVQLSSKGKPWVQALWLPSLQVNGFWRMPPWYVHFYSLAGLAQRVGGRESFRGQKDYTPI